MFVCWLLLFVAAVVVLIFIHKYNDYDNEPVELLDTNEFRNQIAQFIIDDNNEGVVVYSVLRVVCCPHRLLSPSSVESLFNLVSSNS